MKQCMIGIMIALVVGGVQAESVRVITDRTETHLLPVFHLFEQNTGIDIEAVYVDKGVLPRLRSRPEEADLVISSTAKQLEIARKEGLLQPFSSSALERLDSDFLDPDRMYVITSYRPRVIFFSSERVDVDDLSTYSALADPTWEGRVALRSGYHPYNMSLFSQMAEAEGLEAVRSFITGLKASLARSPQGNDRAQVQAIYEGKADVSIGNAYYMGLMRAREDQQAWAEASEVFFPNQAEGGAYVMRSAAALTSSTRNVESATQLLEFLLGDFSQYYFATTLHVHPVKKGIPLSPLDQSLAPSQPGVDGRTFKAQFVPVRSIDAHREAVIDLLDEVRFDE